MSGAAFEHEVALVDAFLAQEKFLSGSPPEFGLKPYGSKGSVWDATWPISDSDGVVESGKLCINYQPASDEPFTIVLVFRRRGITRLDFTAQSMCHQNPHWGAGLGVPAEVCGPHIHSWRLNRDYVLSLPSSAQSWTLPCREPIQPQIRRFDQAFPWFADQINLTLSPDQRRFDIPKDLFL